MPKAVRKCRFLPILFCRRMHVLFQCRTHTMSIVNELYTQQQLDFCRALPKVELHAHLNGSIPMHVIRCAHPSHQGLESTHQPLSRRTSFAGGGAETGARPARREMAEELQDPSIDVQQLQILTQQGVSCCAAWLLQHLNASLLLLRMPVPALPAARRTLDECFCLFDVIHRVTTTHAAISRITREARISAG